MPLVTLLASPVNWSTIPCISGDKSKFINFISSGDWISGRPVSFLNLSNTSLLFLISSLVAASLATPWLTALKPFTLPSPAPIKAPWAKDSKPPSKIFLSSPSIYISPQFWTNVVPNSEAPSWADPFKSCLPANLKPSFIVSFGKPFIPCFIPFNIAIVPILSKATSAIPARAWLVTPLKVLMPKVLVSSAISCSIAFISKLSVTSPDSNLDLLLIILSAASFFLTAKSKPEPPAPDRKNKGSAADPVVAIARDGIKFVVELATHLPASSKSLILSTSILFW